MAFFWSGTHLKNFLFEGFDINAKDGLATLCITLVGSAIFYEGLRTLRDGLLNKFVDQRRKFFESTLRRPARFKISSRQQDVSNSSSTVSPPLHYGGCGDAGDASVSLMRSPLDEDDYELNAKSGDEFTALQQKSRRTESCKSFSLLIISTILHMVYITIGYIFMLAVMTFNVWILVAIALGVGIGQLIFGVFKRSDIFTTPSSLNLTVSSSRQPSSDSEVFLPPSPEDFGGRGDMPGSSGGRGDMPGTSGGSTAIHPHLTTEITVHAAVTPDSHHIASVSP